MTDKEKTIKELKEALDSLDITNKYRLNLIRAIEYLQEESVSEELGEVAKRYATEGDEISGLYIIDEELEAFKAGAKWQEKQDQKTIELAEDHAMLAGMEKMKEQMMAKGVDGVVHHLGKCGVASVHYKDPTGVPMACFISPKGFVAGDKVKVIVIKED